MKKSAVNLAWSLNYLYFNFQNIYGIFIVGEYEQNDQKCNILIKYDFLFSTARQSN